MHRWQMMGKGIAAILYKTYATDRRDLFILSILGSDTASFTQSIDLRKSFNSTDTKDC